MIRASVTVGVACALGVTLSACADGGKSPYASLGEDFAKANKAAAEAFQSQIAEAQRVRRMATAAKFAGMQRTEVSPEIDLQQGSLAQRFVRFVCAGKGEAYLTASALTYTADYSKALEAITKQPDDSFSGYAKALKALRKDAPVIAAMKTRNEQFATCSTDVEKRLVFVPPAVPEAEGVAAVIAAGQAGAALYESLKDFGKGLMRLATIAEQRRKLREFVGHKDNRDNFADAYNQLGKPDDLEKLHEARLRMALVMPYLLFEKMTKLRSDQKIEIMDLAQKTHAALAEYDAVSAAPSPKAVAKLFTDIRTKLIEATDDKYDLDEIIGFVKFVVGEAETVKTQYGDTKDKAEKLKAALEAL